MTMPSSPRTARNLRWLLLGLFVVVLAGCASNAPLDTLEPVSDNGEEIDSFFNIVFWIATAVFVIIQGGVIFLWWKFKAPRQDDAEDYARLRRRGVPRAGPRPLRPGDRLDDRSGDHPPRHRRLQRGADPRPR